MALGLLHCLWAGQTLAVFGDPVAESSEVRLPVTAFPQADRPGSQSTAQSTAQATGQAAPDSGAQRASGAGYAQAQGGGLAVPGVGIPTLAPTRGAEPRAAGLRGVDYADTRMVQPRETLAPLAPATPAKPPQFPPGMTSTGPELRMGVSTPPVFADDQASLMPPPPPAPIPQDGIAAPDQWKLTADSISGQHDSEFIQATGNATIAKGLNTLKADFIRYYQASRWVVLKGNVRVAWEGDILEAEEAEFDLGNMLGWLKNGKVFVGKSHIYFQSETIRKYAASSYRFKNAKVTGCDGDKPAWSFTAEEGDINIDGRTKLWHTKFNAADTPIAYSPFLSLPGGAKRQSGLLIPEISNSRQRGYVVNQAYYWAIDDEHDMTFYENVMTRRGLMQGVEYRHAEDPRRKGDWRVDFLRDRKSAVNAADEELYLQSDGLSRPNKSRWWVRSKYNGYAFDPAWTLKVDLDAVSDQNYLREFGSGSSGFDSSRRNFLKEFGRDIDVADSLTRNSVVYLSRSWDRVGVTGKVGWTQNLAYLNGNNPGNKNPTVQTLPEVNLFAFKDNLPGTPLDVELASRFNYFWREYGTRGARMDVRPSVSLPLPLGPFTLIPSAGLRTTSYTVPQYTNESSLTTANKTPTRTFPEFGFTGFTEIHRVFSLGKGPLAATEENVGESLWQAVRHSVMPRVEYAYQPVPQSQDRLPQFDAVDKLIRRNIITYSVTNVFDRKRSSVMAAPNGNATMPVASTDYLDFLRIRLEQSFDRDEATRSVMLAQYARRPYSDLMLETSIKPEKYLTLTSKSFYSPYRSRFTEHENSLTVTKEKVGAIRFNYDYLYPIDEYKRQRTKDVQILGVGVDVQLTDKVKLTTDYRMDIAGSADLEKSVGLTWEDQCYSVQLLYSRKPSDQNIELRFNLLDFGKQ